MIRFARFWLIEAILAGPFLVGFAYILFKRAWQGGDRIAQFAAVWAAPAALVFWLEPLISDFKPHWAFIAWLPILLALAWYEADGQFLKWARYQKIYSLPLIGLVFICCHFPLGDWVIEKTVPTDTLKMSKLDVTNDLYGWSELPEILRSFGVNRNSGEKIAVVGGWYQTASQASFALGDSEKVTLIPRDLKARDEWACPDISESCGPDWPKLLKSVIFVADQRYDSGPDFRSAKCLKLGRHEIFRGRFLAKQIDVWRCEPELGRL